MSVILVEGETSRELTPHEGEAKFIPGGWAPDGSGFYLVTDEGREFIGLAFFSLADNRYEWLETPDADVEEVALSGRRARARVDGQRGRLDEAPAARPRDRAPTCPSRSCPAAPGRCSARRS